MQRYTIDYLKIEFYIFAFNTTIPFYSHLIYFGIQILNLLFIKFKNAVSVLSVGYGSALLTKTFPHPCNQWKLYLIRRSDSYWNKFVLFTTFRSGSLLRWDKIYFLHLAVKAPCSTSIKMISPALTWSARINFAAKVSTVFCRYRFSGLAPYTGS